MHGRILRNWCAKISTIILLKWIQNAFIFFYASFKGIFRLDITWKSYASRILIVILIDRCILNLLHHGFPSGNPEDDRSGTRRTKAPTVVYRLDEILKEIRHWRSSGPRWPSPSIHPTSLALLAEPLKYSSYQYLPSFFLFLFPSFFVVVSLIVRYRHRWWVAFYLHVSRTMPYLPYLSVRTRFIEFSHLSLAFFASIEAKYSQDPGWRLSPRKRVSSRWIRSTPRKYNSWRGSRSALRNSRGNMFINAHVY